MRTGRSIFATLVSPADRMWVSRRGLARASILIAFCLCFIAGCSLPGRQENPEMRVYLLQADESSAPAIVTRSKSCVTLRVSPPTSAPGFATNRMAYTQAPHQLEYFAYHQWVDTPARMLALMIESRLDALGLFGSVVVGSTDIKTDFRLDMEIRRLAQDFTGGSSDVNLEIKVKLIDVANRSLVVSQIFSYVDATAEANPVAGVVAANRAAQRFLADLEKLLSASTENIDCPPSALPAN